MPHAGWRQKWSEAVVRLTHGAREGMAWTLTSVCQAWPIPEVKRPYGTHGGFLYHVFHPLWPLHFYRLLPWSCNVRRFRNPGPWYRIGKPPSLWETWPRITESRHRKKVQSRCKQIWNLGMGDLWIFVSNLRSQRSVRDIRCINECQVRTSYYDRLGEYIPKPRVAIFIFSLPKSQDKN